MREIIHVQAGQCGNQIGSKVRLYRFDVDGSYTNHNYFPSFLPVDPRLPS